MSSAIASRTAIGGERTAAKVASSFASWSGVIHHRGAAPLHRFRARTPSSPTRGLRLAIVRIDREVASPASMPPCEIRPRRGGVQRVPVGKWSCTAQDGRGVQASRCFCYSGLSAEIPCRAQPRTSRRRSIHEMALKISIFAAASAALYHKTILHYSKCRWRIGTSSFSGLHPCGAQGSCCWDSQCFRKPGSPRALRLQQSCRCAERKAARHSSPRMRSTRPYTDLPLTAD